MGTPEFSIPSLSLLIDKKYSIISVYTQPPQKAKRGQKINASPIEKFCKKNKIIYRSPKSLNTTDEYEVFKKMKIDLVIVVAYGKIIPENFLNLPKYGFINVHASLLPKWRGAAPIQRSIMNRDKKTGVSIMKIIKKLDSGPLLAKEEMELNESSTYGEVNKELSVIGANLLIKSLNEIKNKNAKFYDQDDNKATYAKKINKDETKINWNLDVEKVIAHIHGLSPNPSAWFEYKGERYKILRTIKSSLIGKPGYVIDENLTIGCKSHSVKILEIQRQGKKKQSIKEFLLGKKISVGSSLN